jgi:hypothetical protein
MAPDDPRWEKASGEVAAKLVTVALLLSAAANPGASISGKARFRVVLMQARPAAIKVMTTV